MTTNAISNYGILLKVDNSGSFVTIGESVEIEAPEIENKTVDATNHGSGGWKEVVSSGLKEISDFTCKFNYVKTDITALYTDLGAGTKKSYQICFPDSGSSIWQFSAFATKIKPGSASAEKPEALTVEVTFTPSGSMVIS